MGFGVRLDLTPASRQHWANPCTVTPSKDCVSRSGKGRDQGELEKGGESIPSRRGPGTSRISSFSASLPHVSSDAGGSRSQRTRLVDQLAGLSLCVSPSLSRSSQSLSGCLCLILFPHSLILPFLLQSPGGDSGPLHVAISGALWLRTSQGYPVVGLSMAGIFSK